MLILVKMGLKCNLRDLKFQKFSGGACPQTPPPLEIAVFYHKIGPCSPPPPPKRKVLHETLIIYIPCPTQALLRGTEEPGYREVQKS